uniref:PH domain-containing protein n=2 Tax=Meloidogyne incognita group TaxID=654580 RepID=A0A915LCH1_MELJA
MAHLIQDGFVVNDAKWKLGIFITDLNKSKDILVRGDLTIGNLMMQLVEQMEENQDWSDHAIWWPDRRKWLKHTRSTLDQIGVTATTFLEFTPMHKPARVELPDRQILDARLDFSVPVLKVTQKLCQELGIRHPEELSIKRDIPTDILRKGAHVEADQHIQPYMKPGEESIGPGTLRTAKPIRASTMNLSGGRGSPVSGAAAMGPGHPFNASEIGTLPKPGTLPRGMSPGPAAYREALGRTPEPGFSEGLEDDFFDHNLINSPKIVPSRDSFKPQNYLEKAALNRGWLDSSRSLMEQSIFEGETVLLRFKFATFFDINLKYDPVRINQLYEQAKWSILLEEVEHTEEEAALFAALQLQATLQRDTPERESPERDEVDVMLDELEQTLDAAASISRRELTYVPELTEYLKYVKPKKLGFNNFKRAYFTFRDLYLSYYNSAQDANGPPLGHYYMKGCEVTQELSVTQGKFHIKLQLPSAEGMTEMILKCDTEQQFSKWMAACRLASRGKTMADSSYNSEMESIKKVLQMQAGRAKQQNGSSVDKRKVRQPVQLPPDFNTEEYASQRYVRRTGNRNNNKSELIAVAHNRIMKINSDNGEATKTWRFAGMKKWHVNWEIRHIKVQFDTEDIEFKPLSADCKVVHEFIGGYIFMSLRSKDQNQTLDEEGFHKLTGGWG